MVTNSLLNQAYDAVVSINDTIIGSMDSKSEYSMPILLTTDGASLLIEIYGVQIWNDDEDDREFSEEKNEYEPLEPFLRKKINEELELIKKIKV
jgi:hypothetical protein